MTEYMDYGSLNGSEAPLVEVEHKKATQVYLATHEGGQRLPLMQRSFISFSFDGKWIEDFSLLAIIENNALQRRIYAEFEDNVTESDVWDGQIYWSSHYKANTIEFSLFTDGITQNELDDFKQWFQPGKIGELVLAEHPNRTILARVSETPEYSILPFEEKTTIKIAGKDHETSTTLYKGKITLALIMDDPFWYSRTNILNDIDENGTITYYTDSNLIKSISNNDAIKIILEDRVPCASMLCNLENEDNQTTRVGIAEVGNARLGYISNPEIMMFGDNDPWVIEFGEAEDGSQVDFAITENEEGTIGGHVAYLIRQSGTCINANNPAYFFYGGTAPCAPIITFTITPTVNDNGYIIFPKNKYIDSRQPYNTITIECLEKQQFRFTTPNIYAAYNQVIDIFNSKDSIGITWEDLRSTIRASVKHWAPREYACNIVSQGEKNGFNTVEAIDLLLCVEQMKNFLKDEQGTIFSSTFIIDCKKGRCIGTFNFRDKNNIITNICDNVGDMVQSNMLQIKERNIFDDNGYVHVWEENYSYCYKLYADCELSNVVLSYKYMYL